MLFLLFIALLSYRFCFGHIIEMHAISCTVETMNI
jgi:hypothetical protein